MGLSRKPNRFGLDPFLAVDTAKANYYYGRVDINPEDDESQDRALSSAAKNEDPSLDKTLPWMLLMRGMYAFLYKKEIQEAERRRGPLAKRPGDALPRPIRVLPHQWAEAFNIITFSYVQNEFFRRPRAIQEQVTADGRKVALALLVQDPGKGRAKSESYLLPEERPRTVKILKRMERHRQDLASMREVQRYLTSLRDPEVSR